MRKIISFALLVSLALIVAACAGSAAGTPDHSAYIPESAELIKTQRDDGVTETVYKDADGNIYELYADDSGTVRVLKFDSPAKSAATDSALTSDEAFAAITAVYPNAYLIHAHEDRDDGAWEWDVVFSDDGIIGEYQLDAGTGAVLDYTIFYGAPFGFDPADIITASYAGAEIISLDLDKDDGRLLMEGKARLEGRTYEFMIDIESGKLTEWEWDD